MKIISGSILLLIIGGCSSPKKVEYEEHPLLETMGYYQQFSHKIWLAGTNQNWELAEFYTHELGEITEIFVEGKVIHDGIDLSTMVTATLVPAVGAMEDAIEKRDEIHFVKNYKALVLSCNKCHTASGHSFIKIKVPDSVNVFNQEF